MSIAEMLNQLHGENELKLTEKTVCTSIPIADVYKKIKKSIVSIVESANDNVYWKGNGNKRIANLARSERKAKWEFDSIPLPFQSNLRALNAFFVSQPHIVVHNCVFDNLLWHPVRQSSTAVRCLSKLNENVTAHQITHNFTERNKHKGGKSRSIPL